MLELAMAVGVALVLVVAPMGMARAEVEPVPDKTVVLTFDDGVKSHLTYVAPLLKEHGFGATFFIPYVWRDDPEHFLTWEEVAQIHAMGFEIGNHSWTHPNFGNPKVAARLAGELALVENELKEVGVPKPVSFAWTGNGFGPEAIDILRDSGYRFARRGMQPEVPYGKIQAGPMYEPSKNDPLLIPSAGDAYPEWTLEAFKAVVERARDGKIAVVQFHGVPDPVHPWVDTPPERFREYMDYLAENGYRVIAMRDLERYVDFESLPQDLLTWARYPRQKGEVPQPPVEVAATQDDLRFWLGDMLAHRYTPEEMIQVTGLGLPGLSEKMAEIEKPAGEPVGVLPYPGGRHPRIGFLEGAIDPLRGTKASLFAPWADGGYALIDLPEAIFSDLGLTFLAHTHIPTIWNEKAKVIDNVDWQRGEDGRLTNDWALPNGVRFGAEVVPLPDGADCELWLENGTAEPLTGLRTQVCVMLKGLKGFEPQTNDNKIYENGVATVKSADGSRCLLVAFDRAGRVWGNPACPCLHSDPVLPDAAPGARVSVRGRVVFCEASELEGRAAELRETFHALAP